MRRGSLAAAVLAFAACLGATPALASSLLFDCRFPTMVSQRAANVTPTIADGPGAFLLKYFYNPNERQMTTLDGEAIWSVQFIRGIEAMTIIQDNNVGGNVSTVVIVVEGADRGRAVYNRMTMLAGGALVPHQFYGRCEHSGLVPIPPRR